jgi:hypothetical protein
MPLSIDVTDQKTLQSFLARRHPDYRKKLHEWIFCQKTYDGGREWFNGNVFRYIKEGDQEYLDRCERAYRFPHTKEVVDLVQKYIFKSDIARNWDDAPDYIRAFWKDATLSKLTIEQYMKLVASASSIEGRAWVCVDSTKTDSVLSKADEKAVGARCYTYLVPAKDVLDIGFDEHDDLNWILVREYKRDDADPIKSSGVIRERYRLWTTDSWYLFEINENDEGVNGSSESPGAPQSAQNGFMNAPAASAIAQLELPGVSPYIQNVANNGKVSVQLVSSGQFSIGRVPFFPVDNVIGDNKYSAPSLIGDIAHLDKAVANYLSNLDAIIQDQTFSQLAMPAQGMMPGTDKYEALIGLGTKRVFTYDGESGAKPEYLSPDVKQAEIIVVVINKIINEIYHSVGMGEQRTEKDNAVGTDSSSGVAKAYDFERLNSLLTTKSASLQNAEDKLIELVALWNGEKLPQTDTPGDDGEPRLVQYADTFDVRSLYDEFTVAERLELIDAPELVRQTQMRTMIDKMFPSIKASLKKAMLAQLVSWPITGADQIQIQAVNTGNPTATFPAKLTSTMTPGAPPPIIPQVPLAPVIAGPGGNSGGKAKKASKGGNPKSKNPGTANRQGQVTSQTGK